MITSKELRQKYLDFFVEKGHKIVPSASLIPENDPTVLFTTAGMHPLVPYLLGEKHPEGEKIVSVQKCVRTQDIEEVGDNRHDTFFEMLGNWSFGNYFKKESIQWSWEFLISDKWLGLDPKMLAVSVFAGDENASKDEESAGLWQSLGVSKSRIAFLPRENNWWSSPGQTGPCGPDTEIFYWAGEEKLPPEGSNPGTDEDNWLEIWNNVFMEYNKIGGGKIEALKQKNVDTGMGLERTLMVLNRFSDVFQIDTFWPLIQKIEEISGREYVESSKITHSMRVVADHIRTATMIIGDDKKVVPSNMDQGYIVRRLIRRAIRHGRVLNIKENFCSKISEEVIKIFSDVYPEVLRNKEFIITEIAKEESKFRNTIEQGIKHFNNIKNKQKDAKKIISGKDAFDLYQSYGFPIEMTEEFASEDDMTVNRTDYDIEMKKHQDLSRAGAEQKFKGGLEDGGEMSKKYHTTTHLLHSALRKVLGNHVEQRGSNITSERLRFDFSHPEKMTEEEKDRVEELVNYAINHGYPVDFEEMNIDDAEKLGAIGLFKDKYDAKVKVYSIGDKKVDVDAHENSLTFSREICGGPHVKNTKVLGKFKIKKEQSASSGVRRIKGTLD